MVEGGEAGADEVAAAGRQLEGRRAPGGGWQWPEVDGESCIDAGETVADGCGAARVNGLTLPEEKKGEEEERWEKVGLYRSLRDCSFTCVVGSSLSTLIRPQAPALFPWFDTEHIVLGRWIRGRSATPTW